MIADLDLTQATKAVERAWSTIQDATEEHGAMYTAVSISDLALLTAMASLFLAGEDG